MITISGRTFEHKPLLRSLGAQWNDGRKVWTLQRIDDATRAKIASTVGLVISGTNEQYYNAPAASRRWEPEPIKLGPPVRIGDDFTYLNCFRDQDPHIYQGFSSLAKFTDYVAGLDMPVNDGRTCDIGWIAKPDYAGTADMSEALHLARYGWSDGLGIGERLLPPEPLAKRRKRSMAGGTVNVGRLLAGVPDHMTRRTVLRGRKIATIFVETVMWEGIKINTALLRVIAIAAIIDRMEQQGYSCNVVAVYSSYRHDLEVAGQTVVAIKEAGERLSISDISFAFGHPSYGRRLVYAANGVIPDYELRRERRGVISEAFDHQYKPRQGEYYIPQLRKNMSDIWAMLAAITPDNLPIEIKEP